MAISLVARREDEIMYSLRIAMMIDKMATLALYMIHKDCVMLKADLLVKLRWDMDENTSGAFDQEEY